MHLNLIIYFHSPYFACIRLIWVFGIEIYFVCPPKYLFILLLRILSWFERGETEVRKHGMLWLPPFCSQPHLRLREWFWNRCVTLAEANQKGNLILNCWVIEEGKTIFTFDARFWVSNKAICKVRTFSEMYADYSQFI